MELHLACQWSVMNVMHHFDVGELKKKENKGQI